jgi:hypothetical protein
MKLSRLQTKQSYIQSATHIYVLERTLIAFLLSQVMGREEMSSLLDRVKFVGASESACHLCLTDTKEFWYVLKVHGNTPIDKECYMVWL